MDRTKAFLDKMNQLADSEMGEVVVSLSCNVDCTVTIDKKTTYTIAARGGIRVRLSEGKHTIVFVSKECKEVQEAYHKNFQFGSKNEIYCDMRRLVEEQSVINEKKRLAPYKRLSLMTGLFGLSLWCITAILFFVWLGTKSPLLGDITLWGLWASVLATIVIVVYHYVIYTKVFWKKGDWDEIAETFAEIGIIDIIVLVIAYLIKWIFKAEWAMVATNVCWIILAILVTSFAVYGVTYLIKEKQ